MLSATLYLTACSIKNRTRRWLRRLREPRYLIGFILAAGYLYLTVFARLRASRRGPRGRNVAPIYTVFPSFAGVAPLAAGSALLLAAAGSWLLPATGRLLDFDEAEVQFLFPAPVHRRSLLLHRLIRSQAGLLFASLVPALAFAIPAGSAMLAVRSALGIWLLLVTARVYFSAIALSRSQLNASNPRFRRIARLPLIIVLAAIAIVAQAVVRAYSSQPFSGFDEAAARLTSAVSVGAPRLLLWPVVALVRPFFAPSWASFLAALFESALVAIGAMVWLIAIDEVFQGASLALREKKEAQPQQTKGSYTARAPIWTLAPTGRTEAAFVWKTVMQMTRVVDRRVVIRLVMIVFSMSVFVVVSSRTRGLAGIGGIFTLFAAAYTVLLAPQILRLDLRQDLGHLDLLKTWPVRGAAVVRGEITGPALALTLGAWLLMALALLFSGNVFPRTPLTWRVGVALGGALVGPALVFAQYAVHNAMTLIFPGWVPLGSGRPRGLDAMGQRLLTLGATWLALAIMVLPGAIVTAVLWLAFYRVVGAAMFVIGGAVCAAAMAIEVLMMTEALGPAYERLDLLAIERPQ